MKRILLFCFFSIGFTMLMQAQQLQFSTWTRVDTYLINDTVFLHFNEFTFTNSTSEGLLVSSTYAEEGNVFTVQDVFGPLACSNSIVGTYTFTIIDGTTLYFTLVSDACTGRANSLTEGPFYRMPPKTIHIPAQFLHIQDGIVAADNHDTVLVDPGIYYENINFMGKKPLVVASQFIMDGDTNHINNTIINGSQPLDPDKGSVVTMISGEDTTSVLCGFTIKGGIGTIIPTTNYRAGGGVFIEGSGCKLQNNYIEYNEMTGDDYTLGGGICAGGPTSPLPWIVLRNNRINHNKAISLNDQGSGGGMEIYYPLIMVDNQISYNEAIGVNFAIGGGARLITNFGPITLDVRNNVIANNKAESNRESSILVLSGGVTIGGDISGIFSNNIVSENENVVTEGKWSYGPGLLVDVANTGDLLVENNHFTGNYFTGGFCLGGGLSIYDSKGVFQNNVIIGNSATHGGGIGIQDNLDNTPVLINNTVTSNTASSYGGGLYSENANANVINTIIWGNTAPTGASIYTEGSTLEVRYSDVEGDAVWPGEGNVNCVATFLEDGYHLNDTCQLVEAGIASIEINGILYECPAYDIDGEGRPMNNFPEIGADEVLLVSVPEPTLLNGSTFNIYPNPASGKITLELNGATSAMIGDVLFIGITGKELLRQQVAGLKTEINVSALAAGVYFIKLIPVDQNAAVKVGKFVKKQ